jgi:hypothetical protein
MSLRLALFAVLALVPLSTVSGCWNPKVKNFGFACSAGDPNGCPTGFQCINGYCDDGSGGQRPGGGNTTVDMSQPAATEDMSDPQSQPGADMSRMAVADMARQPPPIVDMAKGPDMETPMCLPVGAHCTSYKECCSGHCHSSTTFVCFTQ